MMRTFRAATRLAAYVTCSLGLYAAFLVARPFVRDKRAWREKIFGMWTNSFVRISKMKIEVNGTPPKPPFFLVANHISYTDIAVLRAVADGIFVAKHEIENWFLVGRIIRDMGIVFIDRGNRRDIPRAGDKVMERLDAGEGVIVFPEGTSTKGEDVLPFNSSFLEFAARKDVPISYASITYKTPPDEPPASVMVSWWDDTGFFAHLWRLLHASEYTAVITFGDAPVKGTDRKLLAAELHQRVVERFVPVV
jgi:1-acyl-sn-glycerol-3-phosphate acyltransferase